MIFVTVGTAKFNKLVKVVDKLKGQSKIKDRVVIQKGSEKYIPKNCEWFDFSPDLDKYIEEADIVVSHGGVGILFECMNGGKKIIGVANPEKTGNHQEEILEELSEGGYLVWCKDLNNLDKDIVKIKTFKPKKYVSPVNNICNVIKSFLD